MATGLVAQTLNRPERNLTGTTCSSAQLGPKRLELLKETLGPSGRVAVLWYAEDPLSIAEWNLLQAAGPALGVQLRSLPVREPEELETALAAARESSEALHVIGSLFIGRHSARIVELANRHRLPAIYASADRVRDGGLMSYGTNVPGMFRRAAAHMDRVLRGTRPSDLPVEQPTTFDFVINLKTAQTLGLTIPESVLQQATELIQ